VQTDQVLYNLGRRGIGWNLLPWCLQHGLPIMGPLPRLCVRETPLG
jgi:hypothetical protein